MAEGLPFAIKTPEAAPTYFPQVSQSPLNGNAAACKRVLDALAKTKKGHFRGDHHQCLTELNEQHFTSFRKFMPLAVFRRDNNAPLFTDSDSFDRTSSYCSHSVRFSSANFSRIKITRPDVSCKWLGSLVDDCYMPTPANFKQDASGMKAERKK
jgi:hypothetical protein